jgi:hypothetical protein
MDPIGEANFTDAEAELTGIGTKHLESESEPPIKYDFRYEPVINIVGLIVMTILFILLAVYPDGIMGFNIAFATVLFINAGAFITIYGKYERYNDR